MTPFESPQSRPRIRAEIVLVLALSLGASALYSIVSIIDRATQSVPIGQQSTTLNQSLDDRQVFDLVYQLLGIAVDLAPVALVCFLLWAPGRPHLERLGLDGARRGKDVGWGVLLALGVGIPGIVAYFGARALGLTVAVDASGLSDYWWTVPVLILSAARSGIEEEVIMIGYLFARTRQLGWSTVTTIAVSAVIRGTYHLYQGYGAFFANAAMGVLFGWLYHRYGRLLPIVVAHTAIDAAVFVGYPLAVAAFPSLFA
jgi:membrane protease YdiL (CAAX protease family)